MALVDSSPPPSPLKRKRKRSNSSSWTASLLSFFKRQKTDDDEDVDQDNNVFEQQQEQQQHHHHHQQQQQQQQHQQQLQQHHDQENSPSPPDLVNLILQSDLEGLKKHICRPSPHPPFSEREEGITPFSKRKLYAENNPLFVAALLNRVEEARLLLQNGWKIAEDRTMMSKEDFYVPGQTPLGIAFEKQNEVLGLFLTRLVKLEERGLPTSKKRKRRAIRSESMKVVAHSLAPEDEEEMDLVDLVLDNNTDLLSTEANPPPRLVRNSNEPPLSFQERAALANDNPLYVAAKIGRDEAANILLKRGWRMTEDRTVKSINDLDFPYLTPLGVAYQQNFSVLDVFLNHALDLECALDDL